MQMILWAPLVGDDVKRVVSPESVNGDDNSLRQIRYVDPHLNVARDAKAKYWAKYSKTSDVRSKRSTANEVIHCVAIVTQKITLQK